MNFENVKNAEEYEFENAITSSVFEGLLQK